MVDNSKEYWDTIYTNEINRQFSRIDIERWQLILSQVGDKNKVLEFGCGVGEFIYWLAKQKPLCSFTGIDISEVGINCSKEHMPNFKWIVGDNLLKENTGEKYNVIIAQHVYEHLTDEGAVQFIKDAYELLEEEGNLIIVLPINDTEWHEHEKIWQVEDVLKLCRGWKKDWQQLLLWRPMTAYKRDDGHNDNDFEEALIYMKKRVKK